MASQRLTNDDRDRIVEGILKPIKKEISLKAEEFGKNVLDPILLRDTPEEIILFRVKYERLLSIKESFSFFDFFKDRSSYDFINIPVKNFIVNYHDKERFIEEILSLKEGVVFVKEINQLRTKKKSLKGRTKCVLENIRTTKQLKDQFPEAYLILMDVPKEMVKNNSCDDIENLRAELSKYK